MILHTFVLFSLCNTDYDTCDSAPSLAQWYYTSGIYFHRGSEIPLNFGTRKKGTACSNMHQFGIFYADQFLDHSLESSVRKFD